MRGNRRRANQPPAFPLLSDRPLVLLGRVLFAWAILGFFSTVLGEGFDPAILAQIDAAIQSAINDQQTPGAVYWLQSGDRCYHKAYGHRAVVPELEPMTEDTIFDIASLTKAVATAPALMILYDRGLVRLDEPVRTYIPEFKGGGKDSITLRHLLTHTSGFGRTLSGFPNWRNFKRAFAQIGAEHISVQPGTHFLYSDINFIILGEVIRRVSGMPLNEFAAREIFAPLKMVDTKFLPPVSMHQRIAPTERVGGEILRGQVHDPKGREMGGVAGHAGVFTTAADLARFMLMMVNGGTLDGVRILKPETIALMTSVQTPPAMKAKRGLAWDIDSDFSRPRGNLFSIGSYGLTGFTGVCLWCEPLSKTFYILLTNRVHPDGSGNIYALQRKIGTLSAEAALGLSEANSATEHGLKN